MKILAVLLGAVLLPSIALGGSVCGTVRDAQTTDPVQGAAIFLFDDLGQYSGLYAGSDVDGTWCIDNVPAGTYTVKVERDDYVLATVGGVIVTDDATDVAIDAFTRVLFARTQPNPASDQVTLRWRVADGTRFELDVYDLRGRHLRGWRGVGRGGDRTLDWNLQDPSQRPLPSGTYFAVLRADGSRLVQRIVLVR